MLMGGEPDTRSPLPRPAWSRTVSTFRSSQLSPVRIAKLLDEFCESADTVTVVLPPEAAVLVVIKPNQSGVCPLARDDRFRTVNPAQQLAVGAGNPLNVKVKPAFDPV